MPNPAFPTRRRVLRGFGALSLAAPLAGPVATFAQENREIVEMSMGDADAPVTMIEYASLTCPHCAAFHRDVLPLIKQNFIEPGKVRLVYREIFFDRPGLWGAMLARCAGEDRYFGVIDLLYQNQSDWAHATDPSQIVDQLYSIGRQAGLSDEAMDDCMNDRAFAEALVANYQKNSTADGITSTPSFIVDGEKAGNMGYSGFEELLTEKLES